MYELRHVSDHCYFIESPAKIGLVALNDHDVILIDAGSDKTAGRKVRQILDAHDWKLKAIYNTHSNADHIGGNQYLQSVTGCAIYAPAMEAAFTCDPILEPSLLYGGYPYAELRHKFLMARESDCQILHPDDLPEGIELIELPGHFLNMVGFKTREGIVYLADCLSSKETIDKYGITFIYDVKQYLETLEMVKTLDAELFIPAHAPACKEISELAQYNIDKVIKIADHIVDSLKEPKSFEDLLAELFEYYQLKMTDEQYVLVGSTVRSYLSYLKDARRIDRKIENNRIRWFAI